MTTLGLIIICIIAVPATATPVVYWIAAPWWRSRFGWALMTSTSALALLADLSLLFHLWQGPTSLIHAIAYVVYALVAAGCWLMLAAVIGALRDARRR